MGSEVTRHISEQEFREMQKRVGGRCTLPDRGVTVDHARVNPASRQRDAVAPSPTYRSKWESRMARDLALQQEAGMIQSWKYEGVTFRLAPGHYHRIDFIIGHLNGTVEVLQVKGWHKNLRAGIKGLSWAAQLYPMFKWTVGRWVGNRFEVDEVRV